MSRSIPWWFVGICAAVLVGCAAGGGVPNGTFDADLGGHEIRYAVHGEGPVVMVLPNSWGLEYEGLRRLLGALESNYTVVYFDPRGMGDSGPAKDDADLSMAAVREDFDALRRHLGLEQVRVIGWSNGAMNLMIHAAEYPDTLSHAILLHGTANYGDEDRERLARDHPDLILQWIAMQQELSTEGLAENERTERMKAFWLETWFPLMFADPDAAASTLDELYDGVQFSWRHAQRSNEDSATFDARPGLATIRAKCLVIAGAADTIPASRVEEVAVAIPDASFVLFEHSGHFAPIEEPERFHDVVTEFFGTE